MFVKLSYCLHLKHDLTFENFLLQHRVESIHQTETHLPLQPQQELTMLSTVSGRVYYETFNICTGSTYWADGKFKVLHFE